MFWVGLKSAAVEPDDSGAGIGQRQSFDSLCRSTFCDAPSSSENYLVNAIDARSSSGDPSLNLWNPDV
jgi:hypothetical protein